MRNLYLDLDAANKRGELTLLTIENVQELIANGSRIQIINYGYAGQYNVDEFVPSALVADTILADTLELMAENGRHTYIRYSEKDAFGDHGFHMGDIDRGVMFRVVE